MDPSYVTCRHCENEVPDEPHCVRCGGPLGHRDTPHRHGKRGYAAAPEERWYLPRFASTLYPHLPSSDMRPFRIGVGAGLTAVVVLCLLGLYPLALVAAAVGVPVTFLLYLWDVDLYEDEPLTVIAFTVVWGLIAGIVLGLVARHVASRGAMLTSGSGSHQVVWLGVVLPALALLLAIAGPLVLLPYRKFNDVLDGVTFGACSAATLLAAEAITNSADFLHLGFHPAGDHGLWIARLLTLGIALPVLAAGVAGSACGSFWLRFRAPARDRDALGLLGSPFVAVPLAATALIGAYVSALYVGQWWTLAITLLLAAAALVWLRWMIHIGLREEAGETPIGPPVTCPSCHHETPLHTFCGWCGISMRALPKHGAPHAERPARRARLGAGAKIAILAVFGGAAIGLTALAIVLTRPPASTPACQPGVPCAAPPSTPVPAPHLIAGIFRSGTEWTSDLGVDVRYPSDWDQAASDTRHLIVQVSLGNGTDVAVGVFVQSGKVTPQAALNGVLGDQKGNFLGVQRDTSAANQILSPEIGFVHGISAVYKATVDNPPSPSGQVEIALEAAKRGSATVVVEAITNEEPSSSDSAPFPSLQAADIVLDGFQWTPAT
jgi:hypothetical protein